MFFFFQAEDGIRDKLVTGVQTCALPRFRRSISAAAGSGERAADASVNRVSAIGATLVKRHASCFIVGKPSSANRAIAPSRISRSQAGAPAAPLLANAWKSRT